MTCTIQNNDEWNQRIYIYIYNHRNDNWKDNLNKERVIILPPPVRSHIDGREKTFWFKYLNYFLNNLIKKIQISPEVNEKFLHIFCLLWIKFVLKNVSMRSFSKHLHLEGRFQTCKENIRILKKRKWTLKIKINISSRNL